MNKIKKSLFKNKYLITISVFVVYMLFFDRNDFIEQVQRKNELAALLKTKTFYEQQITSISAQLDTLQTSNAALEKYAREHFLMKKQGEDVFLILDTK
jgi:cell division protein FtsB